MVTSTDELQGAVGMAKTAVAELLAEDRALGEIAFRHVLEHLLGELHAEARNGSPGAPSESEAETPTAIDDLFATESQRAAAIARYFDLELQEANDLFDITQPDPVLIANSKRLAGATSAGTREIALMVVGARTAMALDTGTEHIRVTAERYGRLDPPNFMATLRAMDQIALRGGPKSQNRLVRMKAIGAEEARELAAQLAV